MVGLAPDILNALNKDQAIGRVRTDIRSDFIFAPQYKLVFDVMGDDVWDQVTTQLKSGTYQPDSLITSEVPKSSGMTRPGSIMFPLDRIIYQAVADYLAPSLDPQLDRSRVFSHRLLDSDPSFQMYQSGADSYSDFKTAIEENARDGKFSHAATVDITSYFVHLNHHILENLLTETGIPSGLNTFLVKTLLENWSGRFSYGIPQGLFPSDLLGNFYLSTLDTNLASLGIKSLRYVDDLVLFYESERKAKSSLAQLCWFLRTIGLSLNEAKSKVSTVQELVHEKTELDRLFGNAREEAISLLENESAGLFYGFQDPWDQSVDFDQEIELSAIEQLWESRDEVVDSRRDNLVKFCLGILRRAGSDLAVDAVLNELGSRPHLTQSFCHYVAPFVMNSSDIQKALFDFIEKDECIYDWELQWPVAALWAADQIPQKIVTKSLGILNNNQRANELRACCALLIGKFGNGSSRSNLRSHWDSENSDHVRAAMILSTMFFGPGERKVLLNLWGNHKPLFNLIAGAVPKKLSGSP